MSRFKYLGLCLLAVSYGYSDFGRCGNINGVEVPCWRDFLGDGEGDESLPMYPYAKRENGCSIPGATPGSFDNFLSGGYDFSFRETCNQHDRCYYRLGTDPTDCNSSFWKNMNAVCAAGAFQANKPFDPTGVVKGVAVAACFTRAESMWGAVASQQSTYHGEAQVAQRRYFDKVDNFLSETYPGVFPKIKERLWSGGHGIADRWEFAKLFETTRDVYVTHRNDGSFYVNQYNLDGTLQRWTFTGGHGIADRFYFADVFGTGRDQYVTHRNNGQIYVTQLNSNGSKQMWNFSGGHGVADRWTFADMFGTGRKQYVTHRNNGSFYVTQVNADNTIKNWTFSGGVGIADRMDFAKVFGNKVDVYVTHRNNGQFYTSRLNGDGSLTNRTFSGGHGIADRFAFADIFGTGQDIYVTHRNDGTFYATRINEDGSIRNWTWSVGRGVGDRWAFTDFYGTGREVFVTHKNSGNFYITQLNEDGTISPLDLISGTGIADRWKFANIFGKKSTAYVTHKNNGTLNSAETNNGLVLSESGISGGVKTWQFDVPSDGSNVKVVIEGGTGDADLYVKRGSAPTTTSYDCRPYASGNSETCKYDGAAGGKYYIMLNPYSPFTGVSLQATYQP